MLKALVPVDGSANSDRAVRHVIELVTGGSPLEILLLNVQEPIDSWEVKRFMPAEEIEAMQIEKGGDALQSARALLDAAGVAYTPQVLIGPIAETIARHSADQGCHKIIMGTRGMTALESLVLGSITMQVVHLSSVPVTLVK
ncbi:MAG: universal stress protein [Rhodocyclaceae bacterium]